MIILYDDRNNRVNTSTSGQMCPKGHSRQDILWHLLTRRVSLLGLRPFRFRELDSETTMARSRAMTETSSSRFRIPTGSGIGVPFALITARLRLIPLPLMRTSTIPCLVIWLLMFRLSATRRQRRRMSSRVLQTFWRLLRTQRRSSSWAASPKTYEHYRVNRAGNRMLNSAIIGRHFDIRRSMDTRRFPVLNELDENMTQPIRPLQGGSVDSA